MHKTLTHALIAGALAAAALTAASSANAQNVACASYRPGLFAFMLRTHSAPCAYQGDYMVQNWASYDGPALIAPQQTYSPSPSPGYVHGEYVVQRAPVVRQTVIRRPAKRPVVSVRNATAAKGKPEIVRARAEVRIYNRERMEIKLYRR